MSLRYTLLVEVVTRTEFESVGSVVSFLKWWNFWYIYIEAWKSFSGKGHDYYFIFSAVRMELTLTYYSCIFPFGCTFCVYGNFVIAMDNCFYIASKFTLRNTCVLVIVFINDAVSEFKMKCDCSLKILIFSCYCDLIQ